MLNSIYDRKNILLAEFYIKKHSDISFQENILLENGSNLNINYYNSFNEPLYILYLIDEIKKNYTFTKLSNLKIITHLDCANYSKVKEIVEKHVNSLRHNFNCHNAIAISILPSNNEVISFISNLNKINLDQYKQSKRRKLGSSLKPFLFYEALKNNLITENTLVDDLPIQFDGFCPSNWDCKFLGQITYKDALILSRNIPFVKLLKKVGVKRFLKFLKRLNHPNTDELNEYNLSLALGNIESDIINHTNAYTIFMNKTLNKPKLAYKINGTIINNQAKFNQFDEVITKRIKNLLGHKYAYKYYGKTGTSDYHKDTYFIGFDKLQYLTGIWMGNQNGRCMSNKAFGYNTAEQLWAKIYSAKIY